MHLAFVKPLLWVLGSLLLVGSTVGGVTASLSSHGRPATSTSSPVTPYGK